MEKTIRDRTLSYYRFQRNVFGLTTVLLGVALLVFSVAFLSKRERVIIVPPCLEKSISLDDSYVSPTYLEQFGGYIGHQLLNKTPHTASRQAELVLRHTSPSLYGALRKKLLNEGDIMSKENCSHSFYVSRTSVFPSKMSIRIEGERRTYAGSEIISIENEIYELGFLYEGGRLLLNSVKEVLDAKA